MQDLIIKDDSIFIHGQKDRTTDRVDKSMYVMETLFFHACKTLSLINFPSIPLGDTSVVKYYTLYATKSFDCLILRHLLRGKCLYQFFLYLLFGDIFFFHYTRGTVEVTINCLLASSGASSSHA